MNNFYDALVVLCSVRAQTVLYYVTHVRTTRFRNEKKNVIIKIMIFLHNDGK